MVFLEPSHESCWIRPKTLLAQHLISTVANQIHLRSPQARPWHNSPLQDAGGLLVGSHKFSYGIGKAHNISNVLSLHHHQYTHTYFWKTMCKIQRRVLHSVWFMSLQVKSTQGVGFCCCLLLVNIKMVLFTSVTKERFVVWARVSEKVNKLCLLTALQWKKGFSSCKWSHLYH